MTKASQFYRDQVKWMHILIYALENPRSPFSAGNSSRNPLFSFFVQDKLHMSASVELLCLPFWTSPFIHMLLQVLNIRYMNSVLFMLMGWQQSEDSCISSYFEV